MKVGINGYEAIISRFGYDQNGLPNRVGSGEVGFQLIRLLNKIDTKNEYIIYLPSMQTLDMPKESEKWRYKVVRARKSWTLLGLSSEFFFKRPKLDVFFSPTHYLPLFMPYKSVISILDLSYIFFPGLFKKSDLFQLRYWTKYSVRKASRIITISESSKNDIIKYYKVKSDKVSVVYPGIKEVLNGRNKLLSMEEFREKYAIKGDYILFVGTLQPRKNVARLIEAFSKVNLRNNDLDLVIIGKKGWLYEEILSAPKKFGVEENVKFLDFVPDEDLPLFYKNALCFVLPSLYEGFGLPILEAMKYGCPVITSNVSSLPEAGGDAALYFDPENPEDIAGTIEKVIKDKKLQENMREKGFKQIKKFSWEKAARETLDILEGVAKYEG